MIKYLINRAGLDAFKTMLENTEPKGHEKKRWQLLKRRKIVSLTFRKRIT
jgi:hypothetical protein